MAVRLLITVFENFGVGFILWPTYSILTTLDFGLDIWFKSWGYFKSHNLNIQICVGISFSLIWQNGWAAKLKRQNDTIFVNWRLDRNRNQFQRQLANWWTAASVCKDWRPDLVWFSWEASKMKTISVAIGELVNRGLRLERLEAEASKMNQFYRQFPQDDWICHL